jgi:putative ATPase
MDLFDDIRKKNRLAAAPLAVKMRPRNLKEFLGQDHFLGEGKLLRRMLQADRVTSAIFYGPPGTGKTTLAQIIANETSAHFEQVNAAGVGVKEIREILSAARQRLETSGARTVLFVDELHRFSRSQQDVLLSDVENGLVILLAATTENPFFAVNTPLLSRSQIFRFESLSFEDVIELLRRAIADRERGFGAFTIDIDDDALGHIANAADGDARKALTALEIAVLSQSTGDNPKAPIRIDRAIAEESVQQKIVRYDRTGDDHYDQISAFIKSIRGSDPDAAIYWLASMLEAGEDPRFIARRLVIAAAEDIGNANPQALILAQAAADATNFIGVPECQLPLAQATIYLACSEKSNSATVAIGAARKDVREQATIPVPKHLRDAHYAGADQLEHGKDYQYPHDHADAFVDQDYLGVDKTYYTPTLRGAERLLADYIEKLKSRRSSRNKES